MLLLSSLHLLLNNFWCVVCGWSLAHNEPPARQHASPRNTIQRNVNRGHVGTRDDHKQLYYYTFPLKYVQLSGAKCTCTYSRSLIQFVCASEEDSDQSDDWREGGGGGVSVT